jgi:hypothetical protein
MDAQAAGCVSSACALQRMRVETTQGHRLGRVFDVQTRWSPSSNAPLVIEAVLLGRGGWMERVGLRPRHVDAVPWSAVRRCEGGVLVVDHEAWERERQRAVQNRPGE